MYNFLAVKIDSFDIKSIFANILSQWYYYLALLLFIAIVVATIIAFKPQKKVVLKKNYYIAVLSTMISLSVVSNMLAFGPDDWRFSFVPVICFISGYIFGPAFGFCTGFVGDLIAAIIAPTGVYNPILGLGTAFWGFIPGIIFNYFKGNDLVKIIISFVISYIVCSLCINTLGLYLMYGYYSRTYGTFFAYLIVRLAPTLVCALLFNTTIAFAIYKPIKRFKERLLNQHKMVSA